MEDLSDITIKPASKGKMPKILLAFVNNLDILVPFERHPFKLYEGQRFTDIFESVRANGVIVPIVVRPYPKDKEKYEILSGHNRVAAAREAGVNEVPIHVLHDLTDEEAMFIVTETNLVQRSFADLTHGERAAVLAAHYEAMKKKAYRPDLLNEIDKLIGAPVGHGMRTIDKLGTQHGLGKTTVARYLRVNKLIPALKDRLDRDEIGMRAAEALSYLQVNEQEIVESLFASGKKISIKQADTLKKKSMQSELDNEAIKQVFEPDFLLSKVKPVKLSGQFLSKHFNPNQNAKEIESTIAKALEQFFSNRE